MTAVLNPHAPAIVDEVMQRCRDAYDLELVRQLVTEFAARFDDAPIQDFLEVLVIKEVMDELRRRDRLQPIAS